MRESVGLADDAEPQASVSRLSIAMIGGTGPYGRGLARRFAVADHHVLIGSRDGSKAVVAARELRAALLPACESIIAGDRNDVVAARADMAVLTIPYDAISSHLPALAGGLAGKIVVSTMNPLRSRRPGEKDAEGLLSAAEQAAEALPNSCVVAAFHHLAAATLSHPTGDLTGHDILVCGDDSAAKETVRQLCADLGGRPGIDVGSLHMSRYIEGITDLLVSVNRRYRTRTGITLTHGPAGREGGPRSASG